MHSFFSKFACFNRLQMKKVRVRFAPSPTGALHLGGMRTALYDYLFAKKNGGDFILRIEDTDTARYVEGAEDYIQESLKWCGIIPDESPTHGGNYGPYRQSERREIYDKYTAEILKTDYAYLAFDTPEELDALRKEYEAQGEVFSYDYKARNLLKNSAALSADEVAELLEQKTPYVVRFKMPFNRDIHLEDLIRGKFSINTNALDDKVLVKQDGMPTYHFANIIDDHEMEISHVIRGEEWLPSLALHYLLYEAMNWERPEFAHLSLILKPEGKGKLSKRDGDQFGFPVFPLEFHDKENDTVLKGYREEGYFPEAFINFLALLGWSPADDVEILSLNAMIQEFDLMKVHKAGARFSKEKAEWFNHQYLQKKSDEELLESLQSQEIVKKADLSGAQLQKIISLMKERWSFVKDAVKSNEGGKFFFLRPDTYEEKSVKKAWKEDSASLLKQFLSVLEELPSEDFKAEMLQSKISEFTTTHAIGMGKVMMPLRLALVGELKGTDVPDIIEVLGKTESEARIRNAVNNIL